MLTLAKNSIAALLAAATLAVAAAPAQAGERWHRNDYRYHAPRHSNGGDLLAAGVLGLAAGAVVGAIASQPRVTYREVHRAPAYQYPRAYPRPSADRYYHPAPPRYVEYRSFEPWTPEWYRYCSDRYRSFDPGSGTFMGYDGVRRFCEAN